MNKRKFEKIHKLAKQKGVDKVRVFYRNTRKVSLSENRDSPLCASGDSELIYLSILKSKKRYSVSLAGSSIDWIAHALEFCIEKMERFGEDTEDNDALPRITEKKAMKICDSSVKSMKTRTLSDIVFSAKKSVEKRDSDDIGIAVNFPMIECRTATTQIWESGEDVREYEDTLITANMNIELEKGSKKVNLHRAHSSRVLNRFNLSDTILQFIENGKLLLLPEKPCFENCTFIFAPYCLMGFFYFAFCSAINEEAVNNASCYLHKKINNKVGANGLSIIDDGERSFLIGSRPFDDMGMPTVLERIIEDGILRGFVRNEGHYRIDGNAGRKKTEYNNLVLNFEKKMPLNELLSQGRIIQIVDTMGEHAINPISGNFSLTVKGALFENGYAVASTPWFILRGKFLNVLKNIDAVGNETHELPRRMCLPYMRIKSGAFRNYE